MTRFKKIRKAISLCLLFVFFLLNGCAVNNNSIKGDDNNVTNSKESSATDSEENDAKDKEQWLSIQLSGGTGKAKLESPVKVTYNNGKAYAHIIWSSSNYDYVIVDNEKYLNESAPGENSSFTIPVELDKEILLIADTTAMSKPHEIEYKIKISSDIEEAGNNGSSEESKQDGNNGSSKKTSKIKEEFEECKKILQDSGIKKQDKKIIKYAEELDIERYEDDIHLIYINDIGVYLLIPKDKKLDDKIEKNIKELKNLYILRKDLDRTYLVSTSVMDLIICIDAADNIRLSGTKSKDWYLTEAKKLMDSGDILYAGKYSAPDYELILSEKCNLVIENMMILHTPEVLEKLRSLGIPVIVERSSYENSPEGRLEWIKLYGVLYGKEDEAEKYFNKEIERIENVSKQGDVTCAFFAINQNGAVNIRNSSDYIAKDIEIAGGKYLPDIDNGDSKSTMNIQMEEFYATARDADVLIYNGTIEGELNDINDLIKKNELFKDFKAVKNGRVYTTTADFFQQSSMTGEFIEDISSVLYEKDSELTFLKHLK